MKPTYDELVAAARVMRYWQKAFFKGRQGSPERREALIEASRLEREFDRMLAAARDPQLFLAGERGPNDV